jgi:hypothetical protein
MSGEKKTMTTEQSFIASQLRAKASLGLTVLKSRHPDVANESINQIDNPYSHFNRETIHKLISMLSNQSKADIHNIEREINNKLDSGTKLNWGEEMTHHAIMLIIKSRNPKENFTLPPSILSPSWPVNSLQSRKNNPENREDPYKKRERLMSIAKKRAIGVLNDGKPDNQRRARLEMLSNCMQWNLVDRDGFAYEMLMGRVNKDSEIDEAWINGFN